MNALSIALQEGLRDAARDVAGRRDVDAVVVYGGPKVFAAGADETVIRTMGRWNSDIHQLYVRACYERCCDWSRRAGSTRVTDVAHFDEVADY